MNVLLISKIDNLIGLHTESVYDREMGQFYPEVVEEYETAVEWTVLPENEVDDAIAESSDNYDWIVAKETVEGNLFTADGDTFYRPISGTIVRVCKSTKQVDILKNNEWVRRR